MHSCNYVISINVNVMINCCRLHSIMTSQFPQTPKTLIIESEVFKFDNLPSTSSSPCSNVATPETAKRVDSPNRFNPSSKYSHICLKRILIYFIKFVQLARHRYVCFMTENTHYFTIIERFSIDHNLPVLHTYIAYHCIPYLFPILHTIPYHSISLFLSGT